MTWPKLRGGDETKQIIVFDLCCFFLNGCSASLKKQDLCNPPPPPEWLMTSTPDINLYLDEIIRQENHLNNDEYK